MSERFYRFRRVHATLFAPQRADPIPTCCRRTCPGGRNQGPLLSLCRHRRRRQRHRLSRARQRTVVQCGDEPTSGRRGTTGSAVHVITGKAGYDANGNGQPSWEWSEHPRSSYRQNASTTALVGTAKVYDGNGRVRRSLRRNRDQTMISTREYRPFQTVTTWKRRTTSIRSVTGNMQAPERKRSARGKASGAALAA
jgi:hypothetical protein